MTSEEICLPCAIIPLMMPPRCLHPRLFAATVALPPNLIKDDDDHASTHQGFFLLLTMTALNFIL